MPEIFSKSAKETQKIASLLAKGLEKSRPRNSAIVIALKGNLGAGKTTFVQSFARTLGIKENVLSPTFVLLKTYKIKNVLNFKHLTHIDCYRIDSPDELEHLGFSKILKDPDAVILIEWAEKIKKILPKDALWLKFDHGAKPNERTIVL